MKLSSSLVKWIDWSVGLSAIACAFVACGRFEATDAYTALQITQVQVLSSSDCNVPGTPTSLTRTGGILDVYLPDGSHPPYMLPVLVTNNLLSAGGSTAQEMNNITLTHFTVQLSADGVSWGDSCPATFDSENFSSLLSPGGAVGHLVTIITSHHSQCLLAALNPQPGQMPQHLLVQARIWAKGHHGGTSIQSAPFDFAVDVCSGCLQTEYTDPAVVPYRYPADIPMCASLTGSNPYTGDPCMAPGQDQPIFCCGVTTVINNASTNIALCPGVFTGKTSTATSTSTSTSP